MKKLLGISALFIISAALFTGCSIGKGAKGTVEEMYKAALKNDTEVVERVMSPMEEFDPYYMDDIVEELSGQVLEAEGIENMAMESIQRKKLNAEVTETLDSFYGDKWEMVAVKINEDEYMAYIVKEISGDYYVVDADDFDLEGIQEMMN